uniref:ACT domain-containing protein n=1 Tax=Thermorudis sp. TaxID=1969470 RepID=A0A7C2ZXM9_9BACT
MARADWPPERLRRALRLYVLTDRGLSRGRSEVEIVRAALAGGATAIQLRWKAGPLAEARVALLAISTYDTDYLLVKADQLEQAIAVLTRAGHSVKVADADERIAVRCAWRPPNSQVRLHATFDAQVIEYDAAQDRWLVRLTGLCTTDADPAARALIEAQIGRWAYVPSEARRGLTLPLKYETLTGGIRFFYTDDPRERR